MFFELFLGLRYLKAKRKQTFISVITIISVVGIMVGVMALIVVLSVMNGFRADLLAKILGVNPHILVRSYDGAFKDYQKVAEQIMGTEGVIATSPFIHAQVIVKSSGNTSIVILRGMDPRTVGKVVGIESMIKNGSLSSLDETHEGLPAIIIGSELSRRIRALPGDTLTVIAPEGKLTAVGRSPSRRKYKVTALFDSGMYEYDSNLIFMSLKEVQDLLTMQGRIMGVEVRVREVYKSDIIAESIQKKLGFSYYTRDWKLTNRSLESALRLEKITMFIIMTMIVLVGALNIISTLVMVVMEKTRDVAILRAMGATSRNIMSIFMLQGLLVGLVGTLIGLFSGLGICHLISKYIHIEMPTDFYGITTLPVKVERLDVLLITLAAVIISFLAAIYPSWRAAKLNPVEALRYE
jgi:lipoprotein-releasing system permease protein